MRRTLALGMGGARTNGLDRALMQQAMRILAPSLVPVAMILAASFAAALFAGVGQSGGMQVRGDALQLKFERLNPVTNLGNIFSLRSVTRMVKSLLPAAVVVMLGSKALQELMLPMPVMSAMRLTVTLGACFDLAVKAAWVMVVWSGFDYAMERMAWNKKLQDEQAGAAR